MYELIDPPALHGIEDLQGTTAVQRRRGRGRNYDSLSALYEHYILLPETGTEGIGRRNRSKKC